jgi:hypothetical protein
MTKENLDIGNEIRKEIERCSSINDGIITLFESEHAIDYELELNFSKYNNINHFQRYELGRIGNIDVENITHIIIKYFTDKIEILEKEFNEL